jgi:Tfp pilus assembly protein PilF
MAVPARLQLADSLLALGETAQARALYRELTAAYPSLAQAHYGLGRTLEGVEAVAAFEKALALFPRYGAAQFALGSALRRGDPALAGKVLAAHEADRQMAPPLEDPAMAAVADLNVSAVGLLRRARQAELAGRLDEALRLCQEAVRAEPSLVDGWVNLLSLHGRLGQPAEAEAAFRRAVKLDQRRADLFYNLGVLRFEQGRFDEARIAFQRAADLEPRRAGAWYNLGVLAARDGRRAEAMELFRGAVAADPGHAEARSALARLGLK